MALDPLKSTSSTVPMQRTASVPVANATPTTQAPGAVFGSDQTTFVPPELTGLTPEEAGFVQQGLLPADFAELRNVQKTQGKDAAIALFRHGKKGPFETRYGDPDVMLDGARRISKNPQLAAMVANIQPGDLLVTTYNKPDDVISMGTKGPMVHALICVSKDPVPEFVEALGMSGDINDPNSNKVLHSMMATSAGNGQAYRLMRPSAGLSPTEAEKAVKRAISYAENQLGKPYDFSFTDANGQGMNDAFYCSELAYKAYADKKGADLPFALSKSSDRDTMLSAVADILDGLKPDDKNALDTAVVKMTAQQPIDQNKLVDFIVNQVAPSTEATRKLADTPARRAALTTAIQSLMAGKAFQGLDGALADYSKQDAAGKFRGVTGFFRRVGAAVHVGVSAIKDTHTLTTGIGFWRSLGVTWKLSKTLVPHADQITNFIFGPNDPRAQQTKSTLDTLDGMARDAHRIPLIGSLWPLPSRARPAENKDFVSPTDLAWAPVMHWDYNVRADRPIDQAAYDKSPWVKA